MHSPRIKKKKKLSPDCEKRSELTTNAHRVASAQCVNVHLNERMNIALLIERVVRIQCVLSLRTLISMIIVIFISLFGSHLTI